MVWKSCYLYNTPSHCNKVMWVYWYQIVHLSLCLSICRESGLDNFCIPPNLVKPQRCIQYTNVTITVYCVTMPISGQLAPTCKSFTPNRKLLPSTPYHLISICNYWIHSQCIHNSVLKLLINQATTPTLTLSISNTHYQYTDCIVTTCMLECIYFLSFKIIVVW